MDRPRSDIRAGQPDRERLQGHSRPGFHHDRHGRAGGLGAERARCSDARSSRSAAMNARRGSPACRSPTSSVGSIASAASARASPGSSTSRSTLPATPISSAWAWSSTPSRRWRSAARCLSGGRATVTGTLIGALIIQLVRYTLLANGVPDDAAKLVKAALDRRRGLAARPREGLTVKKILARLLPLGPGRPDRSRGADPVRLAALRPFSRAVQHFLGVALPIRCSRWSLWACASSS